jgi:hypothetical protein
MPINRKVLLLTPIVAPVAGFVAAWLAKHVPGVEISEKDLNEIFLAGIAVVLAGSAQWIHGHQKHEAREAEAVREADVANDAELEVVGDERSVIEPDLLEELDEDDELLDEAGDPLLEDSEDDEALLELAGAPSENSQ